MGFTERQAGLAQSITGTSGSVSLPQAPLKGSLVCMVICQAYSGSALTSFVVKDSNNNSYTITPNSPAPPFFASSNFWTVSLAYLLNAPANTSATVNLTWANTANGMNIFIEEFIVTDGTAKFDMDVSDQSTTGGGFPGNTTSPTITPTTANELLYAGVIPQSGQVNHPIAGEVLNGWTGSAAYANITGGAEYVLSASGANIVTFSLGVTVLYSAMAMAFSFQSSLIGRGAAIQEDYSWLGGDDN